jgi:hypothetical protein
VKARVLITIFALTAGLVLSGCSSDNSEHEPISVEVAAINGGAPVISAAIDIGNPSTTDDDFVPIDAVPFLFKARYFLTATVNDPQGPLDSFHVTGYDMVWTPLAGAPAELTSYNMTGGGMDLTVTPTEPVEAAVIIVPPAMKQEAWYPAQRTSESWTAHLLINFKGHVSGSEHEVIVPANMTVTFMGEISSN